VFSSAFVEEWYALHLNGRVYALLQIPDRNAAGSRPNGIEIALLSER
jgi:hypothetical protein